ncbi:unnamed protein product [Symbiodinium natans]|uniref:Uncharacterized protein n=1 Tax=Symbiodinium natans TaxID=878477 RepID=A0A812H6J1_9DINO|nr:unnamed protein product [Symbiodinium natans]
MASVGAASGVSGAAGGLRARPFSARGRLTREPAAREPSVLVHGCNEPPPDAGGAGLQGPGHFRHFANTSRAVIQDPLRQGDQIERDLQFYSMPRKCTCQGRECGPMRTLDVARINKERHNWQRIDTFQTPYGNGQASWEGSQQRTRTSSRDRARAMSTQALAGLGLELEDLRAEVRTGLADAKEDLSQTIAMAVNQIISELRQDVRTACQEACAREDARQPPPEEPVVVSPAVEAERPQSPMPTAILTELCQQVLQACRSMCEEVERSGRSSREELESLRELREVPQFISQMWSRMDQNHTELKQTLREMDFSKLLEFTQDCRTQMASDSRALQDMLEATRLSMAEAAEASQKVTAVDPAPILEPMQQLVDAVDSRSARVLEEIQKGQRSEVEPLEKA